MCPVTIAISTVNNSLAKPRPEPGRQHLHPALTVSITCIYARITALVTCIAFGHTVWAHQFMFTCQLSGAKNAKAGKLNSSIAICIYRMAQSLVLLYILAAVKVMVNVQVAFG